MNNIDAKLAGIKDDVVGLMIKSYYGRFNGNPGELTRYRKMLSFIFGTTEPRVHGVQLVCKVTEVWHIDTQYKLLTDFCFGSGSDTIEATVKINEAIQLQSMYHNDTFCMFRLINKTDAELEEMVDLIIAELNKFVSSYTTNIKEI